MSTPDSLKWLDWTRPIVAGQPGYPGDPPPALTELATHAQEGYRLTQLNFVPHAGTHLDAPAHFISGGATIDQIPQTQLIGRALVVEIETAGREAGIAAEIIAKNAKAEMLFLKCGSSTGLPKAWLQPKAVQAILDSGYQVLGTDQEDLENPTTPQAYPVHQLLLPHALVLLENIDLNYSTAGAYEVIIAPLLFAGAEAAPARVLARRIA